MVQFFMWYGSAALLFGVGVASLIHGVKEYGLADRRQERRNRWV
jgi:hypothetical protein